MIQPLFIYIQQITDLLFLYVIHELGYVWCIIRK